MLLRAVALIAVVVNDDQPTESGETLRNPLEPSVVCLPVDAQSLTLLSSVLSVLIAVATRASETGRPLAPRA